MEMKIIGVDNFCRDSVADILIAENIHNKYFGEVMVAALNEKLCQTDRDPRHFVLVEDNYRLSKGVKDLV